jgi:hypothetical protein
LTAEPSPDGGGAAYHAHVKGLLLRLSALDADAESAVRVIAFFDRLIAQQPTLEGLLKATATLAECPVGVEDPGRGVTARAEPPGWTAGGRLTRAARRLDGGPERSGAEGATAWLDRPGAALPLDEILLERFAIAAAVAVAHAPLPVLGDPALLELVLDEHAGEIERARALHLLGIPATAQVQAVAVRAPDPAGAARSLGGATQGQSGATQRQSATQGQSGAAQRQSATQGQSGAAQGQSATQGQSGATRYFGAPIGADFAVLLVDGSVPSGFRPDPGVRMGAGEVCPAGAAPRSWHTARIALRFASSDGHPDSHDDADVLAAPTLTRWDRLGVLALLAEHIPAEAAARHPDVAAIDALSRERGGADTLATLQAVAAAGSIRQAAGRLHMHHSSVAARLARAQSALGFPLDTATGRLRLATALVLAHLRDTAG